MRTLTRSIRTLGLVALITVTVAAAVPLRITGRVVDAGSGEPLPGAQVYIEGTGIGALTDGDGRYVLTVPDGAPSELEVVVQMLGYRTRSAVVRPAEHRDGGSVTLDFQLEPSPLQLESVIVTDGSGVPAFRPSTPLSSLVVGGHPYDREQYAHIEENAFRAATDHPLSTFSIDVDRASLSNVRRFLLREHRLPPMDAVQVEEMINYFPYDYALPEDGQPLAVTTELGRAPWSPEHLLLRIGLASRPIETAELPPSNLVFLLDVSGSMVAPDKLPLVKRSLRLLVNQLRPEDRVAIVVYAGAAGLVLEPTPGDRKDRILDAIDRLEAGGSTAGGAGLRLAYDVARRHFTRGGNNRVVLATDGDFNVGESSDAAMIRLVEDRRREGTYLSVLGFGRGNLQSTKMQGLAQHGNGNYAYIDGIAEARKVLVGEMGGTLLAVAKDVKIQVEFNPQRVRSYRLIGYENRLLAAEDFNDDRKDAGELGAGHTVTALYEIVPVGSDSDIRTPAVDPLRYQTSRDATRSRGGDELAFVKVRYKEPTGTESRLTTRPVADDPGTTPSEDFRFAAAVAGFGMLLRESEHRGTLTAEDILALARAGLGEDPFGYRRGFIDMVEAYCGLAAREESR